ncbi:hypothetical protein [Chondromyces crocatus]|uniref:Secreted protein n=1 Tax=Chondromyces crocatus TaxID=52 RepID=A0A0K1EF68_CHOCO|nr:hypothetical protein [Chondromyces crocatus]AKT39515.1 uncharacterized protein CMC5_036620 [Chondromyces crocatus]
MKGASSAILAIVLSSPMALAQQAASPPDTKVTPAISAPDKTPAPVDPAAERSRVANERWWAELVVTTARAASSETRTSAGVSKGVGSSPFAPSRSTPSPIQDSPIQEGNDSWKSVAPPSNLQGSVPSPVAPRSPASEPPRFGVPSFSFPFGPR